MTPVRSQAAGRCRLATNLCSQGGAAERSATAQSSSHAAGRRVLRQPARLALLPEPGGRSHRVLLILQDKL